MGERSLGKQVLYAIPNGNVIKNILYWGLKNFENSTTKQFTSPPDTKNYNADNSKNNAGLQTLKLLNINIWSP